MQIPVKCDLRPEPVPDAITTSLGIKGCYQDMPPRVLAETMGWVHTWATSTLGTTSLGGASVRTHTQGKWDQV
jgi:hypothetical protein